MLNGHDINKREVAQCSTITNGHEKSSDIVSNVALSTPLSKVCILIPGVLGWGPVSNYWDQAIHPDTNTFGLRVVTTSPGAISSHHDRACEIYAQILGLCVDYGSEHSTCNRHARYGRDYSGQALYAEWNSHNPVHLVCQAQGANTARYLQHLLEKKFWNEETSGDWIRSISCISAPLNGTTLCYMFQMDETTGVADKEMLCGFLKKLMTALKWISIKFKYSANTRQKLYDWSLRHYAIYMTDFDWKSQVKKSTFFTNNDHLWYECTLHGAAKLNKCVMDNPHTYYLSYVTCTSDSEASPENQIHPTTNPVLIVPNGYILNKSFQTEPLPGFDKDFMKKWRNNDGQINEFSQRQPISSLSGGRLLDTTTENLQPGMWYHESVQKLCRTEQPWDHFDTIIGRTMFKPEDLRITQQQQRHFYELIYSRIASLPDITFQ